MSKMNELAQALDELTACGETLVRVAKAVREAFNAAPPAEVKEPADETAPDKIPIETAATTEMEPQPEKYTFLEVRQAFSAKAHAGYTDRIRALLTAYGADRLSDVKEEDYTELMKELEAMT